MAMLEEDYIVSQLYRTLETLNERVNQLEINSRSDQLGVSTVDASKGRGFLSITDGQMERARLGRMPDGTITTASVNNPNPPSVPDASTMAVIPIIGGLCIGVEKLISTIPYDFSHLRIYVDGLLDGTITKVPGIWIAAPLDPGTTHTVQVSAVNQSGKESAKSAAITAQPLKVVDEIALGEINETLIADDSISTPKLQALAITAGKIAVNAVEATHIKAGSVTADKLAATIILAQKRLIVGDPVAKRVEINDNGIEQYSALGKLLIQMAAGSVSGNIWTVVDPNNSDYALATLDSGGGLSVEALRVNSGEAYFNGRSFDELLGLMPRGVVARTDVPLSGYTTARIGLCEISAVLYPGRLYRFKTGTLSCQTSNGAYGYGIIYIQGTIDGSKPTINSLYYVYSYINAAGLSDGTTATSGGFNNLETGDTGGHKHFYNQWNHGHAYSQVFNNQAGSLEHTFWTNTEITIRLLLTYDQQYGASSRAVGTTSGISPQFYIEDIGPYTNATGGVSIGDGSGSTTTRYVRTYQSIYTKYWNLASATTPGGNQLAQGGPNGVRSTIGFNFATIRTDILNSNIEKIELFLYANAWTLSTGGFAVIGTHNDASNVNTYTPLQKGLKVQKLARPEGRWIDLPTSIGDSFAAGTVKGFILDASSDATPLADIYAGSFDQFASSGTKRPQLRITYRK